MFNMKNKIYDFIKKSLYTSSEKHEVLATEIIKGRERLQYSQDKMAAMLNFDIYDYLFLESGSSSIPIHIYKDTLSVIQKMN